MEKPQISWQGIGISSNPFQRQEPLSIHLQSYLEESAQSAESHIVVIADEMQIPNYQTMYGIIELRARKIARKKGRAKQRNLEKILGALGISNVRVLRFEEVFLDYQKEVVSQVQELFNKDQEVREAILKCVPKRLIEKAESLEQISQYAITEIGLILSMQGTKFGHEREKAYDFAATLINRKYGIGREPSFTYSSKGLEFIPDKNLAVEPYSTFISDSRLLLTDSESRFKDKVNKLEGKSARKVNTQLKQDGMQEKEPLSDFYRRKIKFTRRKLTAPRRLVGFAASVAAGILALISTAGYLNNDAESIRQKYMSQISIFGLNGDMNTCFKANQDALDKANREIQTKYKIRDYFKS